jgi:hypothetical protein
MIKQPIDELDYYRKELYISFKPQNDIAKDALLLDSRVPPPQREN